MPKCITERTYQYPLPSLAQMHPIGTKPPLWLSIDGMAVNGALQTGFEIEEAGCGQPPLTKAVLQDATLIAVIEMSQSSWFVAGIAPGVERQPFKKLVVILLNSVKSQVA